jgi:hypothetical protein
MGWHNQSIGPNPRILCGRCARGNHDWQHSELGCLVIIGRFPRDFLCVCDVKGKGGRGGKVYSHRTPLMG